MLCYAKWRFSQSFCGLNSFVVFGHGTENFGKQTPSSSTTRFRLWQLPHLHLQFPIVMWSFNLNAYKRTNTFQRRNVSHITSILWMMTAHENTRKTISSQDNFVVMMTSFIRLRNQVTNVRVVKRTRHKKYIDRLPLCVLRSFELFFIGLICGVNVWASLVVIRLEEIRLESLIVFPCFVFCRMFLRRNRTSTTRIPRLILTTFVINKQWS